MRATYSIDDATEAALRRSAGALRISKSEVVRLAVREFDARRDRLTESERRQKLAAIARLRAIPPAAEQTAGDLELAEIRRARRAGWRGGE